MSNIQKLPRNHSRRYRTRQYMTGCTRAASGHARVRPLHVAIGRAPLLTQPETTQCQVTSRDDLEPPKCDRTCQVHHDRTRPASVRPSARNTSPCQLTSATTRTQPQRVRSLLHASVRSPDRRHTLRCTDDRTHRSRV
jgi:hypothetical protein